MRSREGSSGAIVLAGGAGFLGRVLTEHFVAQKRPVIILTRRGVSPFGIDTPLVRYLYWDGESLGEWAQALDGAAAVINLAGRSVNCRYHARNREEIYESRLRSTRVLGEAIASAAVPPPVWINSSSATIYRHAEDREMDEATGEIGSGFSVDVCQKWETELEIAPTPLQTRKVALRSAMVFGSEEGGALDAFRRVVRLGLGGPMGGGRQYVSWIHAADFAAAVDFLIARQDIAGPVNLVAPEPATNAHLLRILRRAYHAPFGISATRWMLEIGALLLGTETELLLKSRRVVPGRLLDAGFRFAFPDLESAIADLTSKGERSAEQGACLYGAVR